MPLVIPGVDTVHERDVWQDPAFPVTGPATQWSRIDTNVAHYTADDDLIDGDPGEHADDLPAYLRQIQRSYVTNRGYSVGYWFAVDWLGGVWQLRGFEFMSAANKGWNERTAPLLFLVDGADRLTVEAARSGAFVYREVERRANRLIGSPRPHSAIGSTACPGDGIRADITDGLLEPIDPPPAPVPDEEDDMAAHPFVALYVPSSTVNAVRPNAKWFLLLRDGSIRHCTGPDGVEADANAVPHRTIEGPEHYDQLDRLSRVNEPA